MSTDPVAIACTLESAEVPARLARWAELAARVTERHALADGVRVTFDRTVRPGDVADLAAAESACCAFFTFSLRLDAGTTTLDVTAPGEARELVDALFPPG